MKIVINDCFGGFGLSHKAVMLYAELKGLVLYAEPSSFGHMYYLDEEHKQYFSCTYRNGQHFSRDFKRDDPVLVQVVEQLGKDADGFCASLKVVEIPDDVEWHINEYDGSEHIAENHRTWS